MQCTKHSNYDREISDCLTKQGPMTYFLQKMHFKYKDKMEVKGWKKYMMKPVCKKMKNQMLKNKTKQKPSYGYINRMD